MNSEALTLILPLLTCHRTPRLSRARKPERSAGCRALAAGVCSAQDGALQDLTPIPLFFCATSACCKDRGRGLTAGRYSAPHGADDNRERSWTIRHAGEIAGANVPLDFAPRFGRQPRDTLANPTRPGREA